MGYSSTTFTGPLSGKTDLQPRADKPVCRPRLTNLPLSRLLPAAALLHTCSALAALAQPAQQERPPSSDVLLVRVMSLNIRYDNPDDGPNAWPHRRDLVAQTIQNYDVDIAGLQEVLRSQIQDLQQRLPQYQWYGVGRDDGKERGEFVPVFFRKDRWELTDKGEFWLSERPDEPGRRDWGAACPRVTTRVRLRHKASGKSFVLFNTHFDNASAEARHKAARLLAGRLAPYRNDALILTGDLNCLPDSLPYQILTGAPATDRRDVQLVDSYKSARRGHQGPDSTWNGFEQIVPGRRIDFIMYSGSLIAQQLHILDIRAEGRFVSDHLPVLAELLLD